MLSSSAVSTDLETDRCIPVEVVEETSEWRLPACGLPETEAELCVPQTTCGQRHKQSCLSAELYSANMHGLNQGHFIEAMFSSEVLVFSKKKSDLLTSAIIFSLLKHVFCNLHHLLDIKAMVQKLCCICILKQLIDFTLQESKTIPDMLYNRQK